mmetsp:Transcript_28824/g.81309  ORF Transcript_28824/g.81309 Transcript_28824/m.81309 type:complete len:310 (+) Transcript_28824:190-1119(+)|eukprot:CAMPEP_0119561540 /NCGR_PEP_ID=MMETSP1352-20130426/17919_1 /TAXON_ID=265584 /ORGANISM="Stauroneis constricta, Strain CCMP1120" /LENGTH=309 /DNA_ID=CAMNT_0007609763 /DNA_START=71 /DNA_END=1000 /DNA_ORIENTATION=+
MTQGKEMEYGKSDEPEIMIDIAAAEAVPLTEAFDHKIDPMGTGFKWYIPPSATTKEHNAAGHEWAISGHDMQVLTTTVPPGETITTEVGTFMYMAPFMTTEVELTCCSKGGCGEAWQRICSGESCVKVYLINESGDEGYVGLTPNFPAKIIPVKFGTHVQSGGSLIAQGGAIMTQLGEVDIACDFDKNPATCCCSGFGCCRQRLTGPDGSMAFLNAGGTIMYRHLEDGESVIVDTNSIVAIEDTVQVGLSPNGRLFTCCFGGESCFSTRLSGPGRVFMQSYSFQKFAAAVDQTVMEDRGGSGEDLGGVA